jgi:DEAD/DEAH box helicase domain-containing protein
VPLRTAYTVCMPVLTPSFFTLEAFLRDILGGSAALLHEEQPEAANAVPVGSLGWSKALQQGFGFGEVYSHQAETYTRLKAGEHVIVTTPTASGKTGAFFPAVFEALENDPAATALLVYPLVALGQDQREKLMAFRERGGYPWEVASFQGNASPESVFTPGVRMVTATPDKLHWSLTNPKMRAFLSTLRFIVLDEAHTYRGGFGSEVAGMLRRLLDLSRALGGQPQVVLSTATIGNPAQFARELIGVEVSEVRESGAARHGKRFYLADHKGQPRRFWDAVMASAQNHDLKALAFFRGRARAARLHGTYRVHPRYSGAAHLYMAGTSDREGRLSEFRRTHSGVMFATNALEAGVDIGDLEVVIVDGYPGSRMAFRQMAGRAGRVAPGLVLYLPSLDDRGVPLPVDAFYSNQGNFNQLLTGPLEKAVVEADNPYLAPRHKEREQEELFHAGLGQPVPGRKYWNLRGEGSAKFAVIEESDWDKHGGKMFNAPLESPSHHYALVEKHPEAVFTLEGQGYKVKRWVPGSEGTAILVERYEAQHTFTRGLHATTVAPKELGAWKKRGTLAYRFGTVTIQRQYSGYSMMREVFERSCSNCEREPGLNERTCRSCGGRIQDKMQANKLSEHLYETPIRAAPFQTAALELGIDPRATEQPTAVAHTLKHLLQKLIPEKVACDEGDLAGVFRDGHETYFFLYDDWRGGLGVARRAYEQLDDLLWRALELCRKPCCQKGCYECIAVNRCFSPFLPSGERRPTDKAATRAYLEALLGAEPLAVPALAETPFMAEPAAAAEIVNTSWAVQARELLDLHGLSLPEVSARLGIPSRDIQRAVAKTQPLKLRHAKFGDGAFVQGFYQGEKREVLVYFPGVGQKRLILKYAGLSVVE